MTVKRNPNPKCMEKARATIITIQKRNIYYKFPKEENMENREKYFFKLLLNEIEAKKE